MPGTIKTGLILFIGLLTVAGCNTLSQPIKPFPDVQKIAVVTWPGPFATSADTSKNPCQKLPPVIEMRVANNLTKHTGVSVETASPVVPENVPGRVIDPLQLIENLPPETFDCVFICMIDRCTVRQGSAYAVSVPAAIGLKGFLFSLPSKTLLWQNTFFESQTSLSENLLTAGKFIKRKGKWISVRALAIEGVDSLMVSLPPASVNDK